MYIALGEDRAAAGRMAGGQPDISIDTIGGLTLGRICPIMGMHGHRLQAEVKVPDEKMKHSEMHAGTWSDQPSESPPMRPAEHPMPAGGKDPVALLVAYINLNSIEDELRDVLRSRNRDQLQQRLVRMMAPMFKENFDPKLLQELLESVISNAQLHRVGDSPEPRMAEQVARHLKLRPPEQENMDDDHSTKRPTASEDKGAPELMGIIGKALAHAPSRQVIHLTRGIRGPGDTNRFGLSMDFDMAVLWIAAWYRRSPADRKQLLKELKESEKLRAVLGSKDALDAWVSEMKTALQSVGPTNQKDSEPMSLAEITALIEDWNLAGGSLRGPEGNDLLEQIGNRKDLIKYLILLLVDEQGKRTIFTTEYDVSPGWTALNFLRHWTVIGREKRLPASTYGPREPRVFLQSWMASDPVGKQ